MCQMLTDSAFVLKTEIFALSLFKRNWTGFLSQKLSCQQKEEFYCVCVKVCHSKLNSCSLAGLGLRLGSVLPILAILRQIGDIGPAHGVKFLGL